MNGSHDPVFERPVFIVSPPRSGSTLLFETLLHARDLYTVGGESHGVIEGVPQLTVGAHDFHSNRLTEADATDEVAQALRQRFYAALRDRSGTQPRATPLRMLEKTPKNSLRIPFMMRTFPEALFVYLYRDPRQVLNSMIEAWLSGRFRTYPALPGWGSPPWSLLLTPDWRETVGKPLPEIVAAQWEASTRALLDDLERVPESRRIVVQYDLFLEDWGREIQRLCDFAGVVWDQPTRGVLPNSRFTVSPPQRDKWRARAGEIEPLLPRLSATMERAARFVAA